MLANIIRKRIIGTTRKFFLKEVTGTENLPSVGPYIIVANHSSYFDHFLLLTVISIYRNKVIHFLTKKEAFDKYLSRKFHVGMGCISINRSTADTGSFRKVLKFLKDEKIVCVYPEGTRSITGQIMEGKSGAVKFALMSKAPLVPVGMDSSYDILPKNKLFPRMVKAKVNIGEPIYLNKKNIDKEEIPEITEKVMKTIESLTSEVSANKEKYNMKESELLISTSKEWNNLAIEVSEENKEKRYLYLKRAIYCATQALKKEGGNVQANYELGRANRILSLESSMFMKMIYKIKSKKAFLHCVEKDYVFNSASNELNNFDIRTRMAINKDSEI